MKKYLLLIPFLLVGCSFNRTYRNRAEDKEEAEKVVSKLYYTLQNGDLQKASKFFSGKFFQVTDKNKFNKLFKKMDEYGKVSDYNLSKWETLVVEGTNSKAEYVLTYDVKRDSTKMQEVFSMEKENDSIKIVGYRVNYDFLLDK